MMNLLYRVSTLCKMFTLHQNYRLFIHELIQLYIVQRGWKHVRDSCLWGCVRVILHFLMTEASRDTMYRNAYLCDARECGAGGFTFGWKFLVLLKYKSKRVLTSQDLETPLATRNREKLSNCCPHFHWAQGNGCSKHSKWHWNAVTAENKVTFGSWLAQTGMTIPMSRDIFTAALLAVGSRGRQFILIFQFLLKVKNGETNNWLEWKIH